MSKHDVLMKKLAACRSGVYWLGDWRTWCALRDLVVSGNLVATEVKFTEECAWRPREITNPDEWSAFEYLVGARLSADGIKAHCGDGHSETGEYRGRRWLASFPLTRDAVALFAGTIESGFRAELRQRFNDAEDARRTAWMEDEAARVLNVD